LLNWVTRDPPAMLVHYTGQRGLFGILESGEIWATKIDYLNDSSERIHGIQEILTVIKRQVREADLRLKDYILDRVMEAPDRFGNTNVCVCSWTENPDDLGQWRAYGKGGQGYALCFKGSDLARSAKYANFHLGPCIYLPQQKYELIEKITARFIGELVIHENDDAGTSEVLDRLLHVIPEIVPFLKDPSFHQEREWRMVSGPIDFSDDRFDVRDGPLCPIPYFRLNLATGGAGVQVNIIVGPGNLQALAAGALMMKKGKIRVQGVRQSPIPLRAI